MKLAQKIVTKHTSRVFMKKYKYKVVLLMKGCGVFRGNDLEYTGKVLETYVPGQSVNYHTKYTKEDIDWMKKFHKVLKKHTEFEIRVESPLLTLYTNTESTIEQVAAINPEAVKYVSFPKPGSEHILESNSVITKRLDYGYKVTVGRTRKSYPEFLNWAGNLDKVRLTKRTKQELARDRSWGGYYFYVKDDKTLTMVKIFLGTNIQSVEKVIKS